jgi:RimJ/RimL family protein N-acetyltransferase
VSAPVVFVDAVLAGAVEAAEALVGARLPPWWLGDPDVRAGLSIQLRALRADPAEAPWRIRLMVLGEERRVIGSIDMKGPPGPDGTVDMGWAVEPTYRGRGFATEAARAVLAWLAVQPGVRRVTARIQPENLPSIRVARRLGLRQTAERHPEQGIVWEIEPRRAGSP